MTRNTGQSILPVSQQAIIVVSGLPRSGTSLMMNMLLAGGLKILVDDSRPADESNPKGYFEYQRVKALERGDVKWLDGARGGAVKIISALLQHLPPDYEYKIIFMLRELEEILASQRSMLKRGEGLEEAGDDRKLRDLYTRHLEEVEAWIGLQSNMTTLMVNYGDLIRRPHEIVPTLLAFLGLKLDQRAMVDVIDPSLYRERSA